MQPGLLFSLPLDDVLDFFALFDNTGDGLDQPRISFDSVGTRTELLDQDDLIRRRIIRQDGHRLPAIEDFPGDLGAHGAFE